MSRHPELPSDRYLLSLLRESMRLYEEALPTATDTQKLVWKFCSRAKFIEGAWPYDADSETTVVISIAMTRCIDALMTPEEALKAAKRSAAASRRWYA